LLCASRIVGEVGLFVGLFLAAPVTGSAQDLESKPWFVRAGITQGYILPDNPFISTAGDRSQSIQWGRNLTVEIGRQTDGSQQWHQLYGLPSYGFGFSLVSFRNDATHATPLEAYTFFSWPFARLGDRLALTTDFGMGVSWHWTQVNEKTDSTETRLGSDVNARIDWGFYLRYLSTPRMAVLAGVDYTHRSNAGMAQPNRGINVLGPKVAVQYGLGADTVRHRMTVQPPFQPAWEFIVGGSGGAKSVIERVEPLTRGDFGAAHATVALQRHFFRYGKTAVGTDLMYDGSTGARIDSAGQPRRADASDRWALGLYGGYEHVIGGFSVITQIGVNAARAFNDPKSPRLYQRFGWRYHVNDRWWSTVGIRAVDGRKASALELGAGYRIRRVTK
jgi:hypothetical protein